MMDITRLTQAETGTHVWCNVRQIAQIFTDPANDQTYVLCGGSGMYVKESVEEVLRGMFANDSSALEQIPTAMAMP